MVSSQAFGTAYVFGHPHSLEPWLVETHLLFPQPRQVLNLRDATFGGPSKTWEKSGDLGLDRVTSRTQLVWVSKSSKLVVKVIGLLSTIATKDPLPSGWKNRKQRNRKKSTNRKLRKLFRTSRIENSKKNLKRRSLRPPFVESTLPGASAVPCCCTVSWRPCRSTGFRSRRCLPKGEKNRQLGLFLAGVLVD